MGGGASPLFSSPTGGAYPSPFSAAPTPFGYSDNSSDPRFQMGSSFPPPGRATTYIQPNMPQHEYDRFYPATQTQTQDFGQYPQSAMSYQQRSSIPATGFMPPPPGAYAGVPYPAAASPPPSEALLQYQQQRRRDAQQEARAATPRGRFAAPRAPSMTSAMRRRGRLVKTPALPSAVGRDSLQADGEAEHPSKRARYDGGPAPNEQKELETVRPVGRQGVT
ncbi:hypothetical protein EXIGLDRAFT_441316 [Exidia glandulosa HHB12029]|uniref:Uncharacterized protein n=1 Tax=Exidia glandulosa HHB12029 TaxID=1314781 RepID=A0A165B6P8_EXIGL|nr:hypothetical protein EXIGLDRAFT_441316 [Exidia glandulosa HHB12029]